MAFDLISLGLMIAILTGFIVVVPDMMDNAEQIHNEMELALIPFCQYNVTVYVSDTHADNIQMGLLNSFDNRTMAHITTKNVSGDLFYERHINESLTPMWRRSDGDMVYTIKDENRTMEYLGCELP